MCEIYENSFYLFICTVYFLYGPGQTACPILTNDGWNDAQSRKNLITMLDYKLFSVTSGAEHRLLQLKILYNNLYTYLYEFVFCRILSCVKMFQWNRHIKNSAHSYLLSPNTLN